MLFSVWCLLKDSLAVHSDGSYIAEEQHTELFADENKNALML